jgi:tetratricopeptide (TPR) repeat protein
LLGIAGVLFYKLPNVYLPVEDKVVYHFENPQFVNDAHYSTFPVALYTLFFYLNKLVWPHPLGFYYGYKMIPEVSWTSPEVIFSLVFYAGIFIFALTRLRQKHILSFAILYYLVSISIFTNIVIKIPGIVGERLAFFPSLGFCIALAYGIFRLLKIDIHAEQISSAKTWLLAGVILIILIPYSVKTITRNRNWKDYLTLFSHDIKYLNNSAKANNVYASQLLREAFNNDVKNPAPAIQQEYLNLAVKHLKRTVEIDPTYKFAWNNLGFVTYRYLDKKEEGMDYMNKAVQLDSNYKDAHFNLGYAYKQQGNYEQSIQHFHEAQRTDPGKMLYYTEEADAWFRSGNREKALILYKKASGLDSTSDQPLIGIGNIYWLSGDTIRAIENWEKAFERNPTNLEICNNLLGYYTSKGNTKAAYYKSKLRELQQKSP